VSFWARKRNGPRLGLPEAVLREGRPWDTGDGRAEASAKSLAGGLPRNLLHIEQIERKEIKGRVISIAAIAEKNDSLGRKPGEYLWDDPAYRVSKVYGDRYGGEWPREQFTKRGVFYEPAEKPKSELYRDLLPLINSGAVDLLDNERLKQQLIMLQRRTRAVARTASTILQGDTMT
jgi:hypothetical protein